MGGCPRLKFKGNGRVLLFGDPKPHSIADLKPVYETRTLRSIARIRLNWKAYVFDLDLVGRNILTVQRLIFWVTNGGQFSDHRR
jgi:hypothetical protein